MNGQFTQPIAGQSFQEDWSLGAPVIRGGRRVCFVSAMRPLDDSLPEASDFSTGVPKTVPYKHSKKKPDHDAVYMFNLKISQDRGLTFRQTGRFAIVL